MILAAAPAQAVSRPVYAYTTTAFSNAPEAVWRVISERRNGNHEIMVSALPGVCAGRSRARPYTIVVSDARDARFEAGSFVMTGLITKDGRLVNVIRHVTQPELRRIGCTAAIKAG